MTMGAWMVSLMLLAGSPAHAVEGAPVPAVVAVLQPFMPLVAVVGALIATWEALNTSHMTGLRKSRIDRRRGATRGALRRMAPNRLPAKPMGFVVGSARRSRAAILRHGGGR
jgi:hypothetical protein